MQHFVRKDAIEIFFKSLSVSFLFVACSVSKAPDRRFVRDLQKGKITEDTSFVYWLPYENNTSHLLVQGYYGAFSHKNRIALDIKMKKGTKVYAARGGVVVRVRENNDKGGLNKKYYRDANMIAIQHKDSSTAFYAHLQKDGALVNEGDTVKQGQVIGMSGNTGYTAFPHLHFSVSKPDSTGRRRVIPVRFLTCKGIHYLKPWKWHRAKHS